MKNSQHPKIVSVIPIRNESKIIKSSNNSLFNRDILYYKDKSNNVYIYYDSITLQYLGYSEDNKTVKKTKNNTCLKIELSIKMKLKPSFIANNLSIPS